MPVIQTVQSLPTRSLTVTALEALDSVIPGEWTNVTQFDDLIRDVSGEDKPGVVAAIRKQALGLQNENRARYTQALQLYNLVDRMDQVAAGAAVAGKVGDLFGSLGFLKKFTPKPETTQAVDAGLKLVAELLAFGRLHGMPTTGPDGLARFAGALQDYARFDLMRIAAWVVFDGVLPLGPNFVQTITGTFTSLASDKLTSNPVFDKLAGQLPGDSTNEKREFIAKAIDTTGEWVGRFVKEKNLTQRGVLKKLDGVLSVAEGGMDYVAAAIDASTNYYSHTGTQTVGRALARHATDKLQDKVWKQYVGAM
jgi:hypothetical protein